MKLGTGVWRDEEKSGVDNEAERTLGSGDSTSESFLRSYRRTMALVQTFEISGTKLCNAGWSSSLGRWGNRSLGNEIQGTLAPRGPTLNGSTTRAQRIKQPPGRVHVGE